MQTGFIEPVVMLVFGIIGGYFTVKARIVSLTGLVKDLRADHESRVEPGVTPAAGLAVLQQFQDVYWRRLRHLRGDQAFCCRPDRRGSQMPRFYLATFFARRYILGQTALDVVLIGVLTSPSVL